MKVVLTCQKIYLTADNEADWPEVINHNFQIEVGNTGTETFQNVARPFGFLIGKARCKHDTI